LNQKREVEIRTAQFEVWGVWEGEAKGRRRRGRREGGRRIVVGGAGEGGGRGVGEGWERVGDGGGL
jgi:hypothetical protein